MSVKIMGLVWELDIPSSEKLVLLAYADHAEHDGTGIYPAIALVARKTGYSQREVQRLTRRLENKGLLIADGSGPHRTNKWRCAVGGDNLSGVTSAAAGGDNLSGVTSTGVTSATARGDIDTGRGVTPMSPEPSLTVHEPSSRGRLSQTQQAQVDAQVSAMIANGSKVIYPNREKIPESYLSYADTYHDLTGQEPTKRVLHDWLATFSDWASEGVQPQHLRRAYQESVGRFVVLRPGSLTNMAAACRARERLRSARPRDEVRETQLLLAQTDRDKARAVPMPEELRQRMDSFLKRKTVKQEVQ
jgi:hypothetical protein